MCLSNNYDEKKFSRCYAIDPVTGQELDIELWLQLTEKDIELAYKNEKVDYSKTRDALNLLLEEWQSTNLKKEEERILDEFCKEAYDKYGVKEGDVLTVEQKNLLADLLAQKLAPFLLHTMLPIDINEF